MSTEGSPPDETAQEKIARIRKDRQEMEEKERKRKMRVADIPQATSVDEHLERMKAEAAREQPKEIVRKEAPLTEDDIRQAERKKDESDYRRKVYEERERTKTPFYTLPDAENPEGRKWSPAWKKSRFWEGLPQDKAKELGVETYKVQAKLKYDIEDTPPPMEQLTPAEREAMFGGPQDAETIERELEKVEIEREVARVRGDTANLARTSQRADELSESLAPPRSIVDSITIGPTTAEMRAKKFAGKVRQAGSRMVSSVDDYLGEAKQAGVDQKRIDLYQRQSEQDEADERARVAEWVRSQRVPPAFMESPQGRGTPRSPTIPMMPSPLSQSTGPRPSIFSTAEPDAAPDPRYQSQSRRPIESPAYVQQLRERVSRLEQVAKVRGTAADQQAVDDARRTLAEAESNLPSSSGRSLSGMIVSLSSTISGPRLSEMVGGAEAVGGKVRTGASFVGSAMAQPIKDKWRREAELEQFRKDQELAIMERIRTTTDPTEKTAFLQQLREFRQEWRRQHPTLGDRVMGSPDDRESAKFGGGYVKRPGTWVKKYNKKTQKFEYDYKAGGLEWRTFNKGSGRPDSPRAQIRSIQRTADSMNPLGGGSFLGGIGPSLDIGSFGPSLDMSRPSVVTDRQGRPVAVRRAGPSLDPGFFGPSLGGGGFGLDLSPSPGSRFNFGFDMPSLDIFSSRAPPPQQRQQQPQRRVMTRQEMLLAQAERRYAQPQQIGRNLDGMTITRRQSSIPGGMKRWPRAPRGYWTDAYSSGPGGNVPIGGLYY